MSTIFPTSAMILSMQPLSLSNLTHGLCLSTNIHSFAVLSFLAKAFQTKSARLGKLHSRPSINATLLCSGCSIERRPISISSLKWYPSSTRIGCIFLGTLRTQICAFAGSWTPMGFYVTGHLTAWKNFRQKVNHILSIDMCCVQFTCGPH